MTEKLETGDDLKALGARLRDWQPDYPADAFSGRGIVICAGGARIFTNAYVLVSVLRRTLGCTLPIEVWHFGAGEMSPSMAALLIEEGVEVVDALPHIAASGLDIRDGWQLKPFALQHCRFEQALLLDADQVPVRDPAGLFDWPEYCESGAVFWPDIIELRETNPVWAALGLPPRRTISFESGQVLVDKRRHWRALSIVTALNVEAERLYRMIYGDKDTFLVGWDLAGAKFSLVPHGPFTDDQCLIQRDFAGAPLFQHRTNAEWSYSGKQQEIEGFQHLHASKDALKRLRSRWNGRVFHAPDRSAAARAAEAEIAGGVPLWLEVIGEEAFELQLLPFGEIGAGRDVFRQNWWCEEEKGRLDLVIADADRVSYRLHRLDPDHWEGTRCRVPQHTVTLRRAEGGGIGSPVPGLVDAFLRASGFPHSSPAQHAELLPALRLLCRVDAGALARLRLLASHSAELAPLLAAVTSEWRQGDIERSMQLEQFYHFVGKDADT